MSNQWFKFAYPKTVSIGEIQGDERSLMLTIFTTLAPRIEYMMTDDQILEAFLDLIRANLIEVHLRYKRGGDLQFKLKFPAGSDPAIAARTLGVTIQ